MSCRSTTQPTLAGGGSEFPELAEAGGHAPDGEDQSDVIRQMQARIQQLEAEAAGRHSALAAPAPAQELFPMQMAVHGGLRQEDWDQLQKLAGPTPKRAPRPEAATAHRGEEYYTQAEIRLEAQEEDALAQLAQTGDPLHRILAMQMQQAQALLARMGPRSNDPLSQVLSGSSDSNQSLFGSEGLSCSGDLHQAHGGPPYDCAGDAVECPSGHGVLSAFSGFDEGVHREEGAPGRHANIDASEPFHGDCLDDRPCLHLDSRLTIYLAHIACHLAFTWLSLSKSAKST